MFVFIINLDVWPHSSFLLPFKRYPRRWSIHTVPTSQLQHTCIIPRTIHFPNPVLNMLVLHTSNNLLNRSVGITLCEQGGAESLCCFERRKRGWTTYVPPAAETAL